MKRKSCFISNSSSSSFIIAGEDLSVELRIPVNLKQFVDETVRTPEELIEYFRDNHWEEKDNFSDPLYQKCLSAIHRGLPVHFGETTDDRDGVEFFICRQGLHLCRGNIEIISGNGGLSCFQKSWTNLDKGA